MVRVLTFTGAFILASSFSQAYVPVSTSIDQMSYRKGGTYSARSPLFALIHNRQIILHSTEHKNTIH